MTVRELRKLIENIPEDTKIYWAEPGGLEPLMGLTVDDDGDLVLSI